MNGNVPDEVEEKNKKKKLSRAPLHAAPGVGETVSLRVAAIELAQRSPKKGVKIADGRLLTELKRGAIDAGFHYPSQPVVWVSIPSTYWLEISEVTFRKIRINSKKKTWKGIYKVSLGEFAKQYFAARCHRDSKRNSPADLPDQQPMSDTARNPNDIDLHQLLWLSEDRVTR